MLQGSCPTKDCAAGFFCIMVFLKRMEGKNFQVRWYSILTNPLRNNIDGG